MLPLLIAGEEGEQPQQTDVEPDQRDHEAVGGVPLHELRRAPVDAPLHERESSVSDSAARMTAITVTTIPTVRNWSEYKKPQLKIDSTQTNRYRSERPAIPTITPKASFRVGFTKPCDIEEQRRDEDGDRAQDRRSDDAIGLRVERGRDRAQAEALQDRVHNAEQRGRRGSTATKMPTRNAAKLACQNPPGIVTVVFV